MSKETTPSEAELLTESGKKSRSRSKPKKDDSIWKDEEEDEEEPNARYTEALKAVQAASSEAMTITTASPSVVEKETRAPASREVGGTPFRDAYETKSVHFIPEVWAAFKQLRPDTGKSLTKLQNEAMAWLLLKYGAMTPELRALFDEFRIEVPPSE